jgi:hypothetical protein
MNLVIETGRPISESGLSLDVPYALAGAKSWTETQKKKNWDGDHEEKEEAIVDLVWSRNECPMQIDVPKGSGNFSVDQIPTSTEIRWIPLQYWNPRFTPG